MDKEPWKDYLEEFRQRADRIPADAFERGALLYEAAHDAYQKTTNRLTSAGWDGDRALVIGRMFGAVVKEWVDQDGRDVAELEQRLRTHYDDWTARGSDRSA